MTTEQGAQLIEIGKGLVFIGEVMVTLLAIRVGYLIARARGRK